VLVRYEKADKNKIKRRPQARKHFDQTDLERLAESLLTEGQLQPIGLLADYTLIWGERRLRAALLKPEITHLWAAVFEEEVSERDFLLMRATENFQRADLTAYEKWMTCKELLELNPEWQMKDLAEHLHLDASMMPRLLSPGKCIQGVRDALLEGKIGISDCYAISKRPENEQADLLALKLSGASRDVLECQARKRAGAEQPGVRVNRIKIELASGVTVTFAGKDLSLDDAIRAASDAQKEITKGRDQGLTAKTIAKISAERSRQKGNQPLANGTGS
jgi:ParB family transcriptional regulator, chromosome partitioning protein